MSTQQAPTPAPMGTPMGVPVGQPGFAFPSGSYVFSPSATATSATLGAGILRVTPLFLSVQMSVSALCAELVGAGDAGSVLRLGVYADNGAGLPGALLVDAGTVAADTVAVQATPTLTPPVVLPAGWVWIGGVVQAAPVTQPTVRIGTTASTQFLFAAPPGGLPGAASAVVGYQQSNVNGALPALFTTAPAMAGACPRVFARVS